MGYIRFNKVTNPSYIAGIIKENNGLRPLYSTNLFGIGWRVILDNGKLDPRKLKTVARYLTSNDIILGDRIHYSTEMTDLICQFNNGEIAVCNFQKSDMARWKVYANPSANPLPSNTTIPSATTPTTTPTPTPTTTTQGGLTTPPVAQPLVIPTVVEKINQPIGPAPVAPATTPQSSPSEDEWNSLESAHARLIRFFSEFGYDVSKRYQDTLMRKDLDAGKLYTENYFEVQFHPELQNIIQKIKSEEFSTIMNDYKAFNDNWEIVPINKRLIIWYGAAGIGKTTTAKALLGTKYADNKYVGSAGISCIEELLFKDTAKGENGGTTITTEFLPLWYAMERGEPFLIDEFAEYPVEVQVQFQPLLDNSKSITFGNHLLNIHDDFILYVTMNLYDAQGHAHPVSAPLVDRALEIHKYVPDAHNYVEMDKQRLVGRKGGK